MMRNRVVMLSCLFAILAVSTAFGQQISDALRVSRQGLHFNARAMGMGNAYSTIGYDFSALRFNPATMAVSNKASYTMTVNSNAFKSGSEYYGANTNFTTSSTTGSQLGLTIPFRLGGTHQSVIGVGYTQAKDFNLGYKYEGFNGGSSSFIQTLADNADPLADRKS